jgi:hypothetical protein
VKTRFLSIKPLLFQTQLVFRYAPALGAAARMSHAARKNLVLATAAPAHEGGEGGEGGGVGGGGGGAGGGGVGVGVGKDIMRVSYITVTPDVDQSSNRGYR